MFTRNGEQEDNMRKDTYALKFVAAGIVKGKTEEETRNLAEKQGIEMEILLNKLAGKVYINFVGADLHTQEKV
jgi:hypothetical protein